MNRILELETKTVLLKNETLELDFLKNEEYAIKMLQSRIEISNNKYLTDTYTYNKVIAFYKNQKDEMVAKYKKKYETGLELLNMRNQRAFEKEDKLKKEKELRKLKKEVKKENWMVSVGSDAHISTMLGEFDEALKLVSLAGLNPENIVNTSTDMIEKYILRK